jgi:hypothetical protein
MPETLGAAVPRAPGDSPGYFALADLGVAPIPVGDEVILQSDTPNPDVGVTYAVTPPTVCPTIDAASLARLVEDAHRQ